jgi:hypothetical protein
MPPITSNFDIVAITVLSFALGFIRWLSLGRSTVVERESMQLIHQASRPDLDPAKALAMAKAFHHSIPSLALSWLPYGTFFGGIVSLSLLRDGGFAIFWWPMAAVGCSLGLAGWVARKLRCHCLSSFAAIQPIH